MSVKISSFTDIIREVIRNGYEKAMLAEVQAIEQKAINEIKAKFDEVKKQVKKDANLAAVEMLQKADINGISFEVKL
jgi:glutathionyl-hydroquinone reductase